VFQTAELGVGIKDKLGPKTEEVGASTKGAANDFKDSAREVGAVGEEKRVCKRGCWEEWVWKEGVLKESV
jgi:hypothetical protein